ncbi:MAG: pyridoxamine 5'-phosphate oxidase family protein [Gemmatimonadales bacterium]
MTLTPWANPDADSRALRGHLAGIVRTIPAALITTVDSTGVIHTRLLPNTNSDCDRELYFLAPGDMPIVSEVRKRPDVLVTFSAPGSDRFIVVNGTARVERDLELVERLWHPAIASWFQAGEDEAALSVIKVVVDGVEVWD